MKRNDGKIGFGEIFKGYGEALDIISDKQRELSVWKGETTELIKPLSQVDLMKLQTKVTEIVNNMQVITHNYNSVLHRCNVLTDKCEVLSIENKQIQKEYLMVKKDYCEIKEENEGLKKELKHIQDLTDIISFTHSKECSELKNRAKKKVITMLGGDITDERYKLFYKKYIMNLYSYIKKELEVSSIDKIPTSKLNKAEELLVKWTPTQAFKKKLIVDLVRDTTPTKNGGYRVNIETVVQFNSLMDKFNGEPEKYM